MSELSVSEVSVDPLAPMFDKTTPACALALLTIAKAAIAKILNSFIRKPLPTNFCEKNSAQWEQPHLATWKNETNSPIRGSVLDNSQQCQELSRR
jgi:hypothetical protein